MGALSTWINPNLSKEFFKHDEVVSYLVELQNNMIEDQRAIGGV